MAVETEHLQTVIDGLKVRSRRFEAPQVLVFVPSEA
jgi:hypothetical protein